MTFSIMSTWLQLLPLNLHHFHPLHCWIPLAPINFWFLLNTIKQPSAFFLNNNDNLLTRLITSCSRAIRGEKRNKHKKEGEPKSKMCLSYQSWTQYSFGTCTTRMYMGELLPALWQRRGWRRSSLSQICLHWRLASQGQPWPPSPAPQADLALASLI